MSEAFGHNRRQSPFVTVSNYKRNCCVLYILNHVIKTMASNNITTTEAVHRDAADGSEILFCTLLICNSDWCIPHANERIRRSVTNKIIIHDCSVSARRVVRFGTRETNYTFSKRCPLHNKGSAHRSHVTITVVRVYTYTLYINDRIMTRLRATPATHFWKTGWFFDWLCSEVAVKLRCNVRWSLQVVKTRMVS